VVQRESQLVYQAGEISFSLKRTPPIKIVFTDRDGVLNRNIPGEYNRHVSGFVLLRGVKTAVAKLIQAGYEIHVVSNQQGIAKGLMTPDDLQEMTAALKNRLAQKGGKLHSVNYCLHLETDGCPCRKPKNKLLKNAVRGRNIDFTQTWMIGDSWRDIHAGGSLGCQTIMVVTKEYHQIPGTSKKERVYSDGKQRCSPDYVVKSFAGAVEIILKK
jgi:D-glycero-D-manno-heptose 1,7-bisphosphate phosphatase